MDNAGAAAVAATELVHRNNPAFGGSNLRRNTLFSKSHPRMDVHRTNVQVIKTDNLEVHSEQANDLHISNFTI